MTGSHIVDGSSKELLSIVGLASETSICPEKCQRMDSATVWNSPRVDGAFEFTATLRDYGVG